MTTSRQQSGKRRGRGRAWLWLLALVVLVAGMGVVTLVLVEPDDPWNTRVTQQPSRPVHVSVDTGERDPPRTPDGPEWTDDEWAELGEIAAMTRGHARDAGPALSDGNCSSAPPESKQFELNTVRPLMAMLGREGERGVKLAQLATARPTPAVLDGMRALVAAGDLGPAAHALTGLVAAALHRWMLVDAELAPSSERLVGLPDLRVVLGRARRAMMKLDDALVAAGNDGETARDLADKLEKERAGVAGFKLLEDARFPVHYDPRIPDHVASDVVDHLTASSLRVEPMMGKLGEPIHVVVYWTQMDMYQMGCPPQHVGAEYDGRIRFAYSRWRRWQPSRRVAVLTHELAHAAAARNGRRGPAWLNEGTAQWIEDVDGALLQVHVRRLARAQGGDVLAGMDGKVMDLGNAKESARRYQVSHLLVRWMIDEKGEGAIDRVLAQPGTLREMLGRAVDVDEEAVPEKFRAWVEAPR